MRTLTCKLLKGSEGFQHEAFPVLIQGLIPHLPALVNGGLCHFLYCSRNILPTSNLFVKEEKLSDLLIGVTRKLCLSNDHF